MANLDVYPKDVHWIPKLTIFRVMVLATTISFGTAKAVTAWFGNDFTSNTVDWVAGVVIFTTSVLLLCCDQHTDPKTRSRFFVLGQCEANPPSFLRWFFKYNLLESSLSRLRYCTKESSPSKTERYPKMTGCRLLTTSVVLSVGTWKAYLSLTKQARAAIVVDWVVGTLAAST